MKRKRIFACTLLMGSMLLSASVSNAAEPAVTDTTVTDSQSESANQTSDQEASDTVTGMIQSIEDNTITLAIMNMPDGEAPSGSAPEMPDGEATTMTITLTDATTFSDSSGNSITLEDLQENSMITVETDASGAAGVFAYADGIAYVSDSVITSQQDTSGGIHVAGGGTLYASNLTVETNGESAAAIRSDRGGGTMAVDGGTYTSNGSGSPAIYCTADITAAKSPL